MSPNMAATVLAFIWLIWGIALCHRTRISWMPILPMLVMFGLGCAIMLNRWYSPAGTILVAIALGLPLVSTVEIFSAKPRR